MLQKREPFIYEAGSGEVMDKFPTVPSPSSPYFQNLEVMAFLCAPFHLTSTSSKRTLYPIVETCLPCVFVRVCLGEPFGAST